MSSEERNYAQELESLIAELTAIPDRESVAAELGALQSIYGEDALRVWLPTQGSSSSATQPNVDQLGTLRLEITLNLSPPHESVSVHILISLPPTYPSTSPPQLQLLSRYIGSFGADSSLFGSVLRVYMSANGVEWTPDSVCVFDGLQWVLELCTEWYIERLTRGTVGQTVREDAKESSAKQTTEHQSTGNKILEDHSTSAPSAAIPDGIQIYEAEPITDRKSAFIGRACRISHPSQVPLILSHLMSDRRISRAAHPIINAWRCRVGDVLHQDNDDDGETAAGGRLAHLLQILDVDNVLIVVTRYFGGIHLGPDRFKHINQAARNALDLGGFLDAPIDAKKTHNSHSRAKKR